MRNPFLKRNPFMSMWLSGANALAGTLRGKAVAQGRRAANAASSKATKAAADVWLDTLLPKPPKRKRRR